MFEGDELREYVGGYDDWVRQRSGGRCGGAVESRCEGGNGGQQSTPSAPAKKLSYKDQRELERLPELIAKLEAQQSALHEETAKPEFYKLPGNRIAAKQAETQAVATKLAAAYERWQELEASRTA